MDERAEDGDEGGRETAATNQVVPWLVRARDSQPNASGQLRPQTGTSPPLRSARWDSAWWRASSDWLADCRRYSSSSSLNPVTTTPLTEEAQPEWVTTRS